MKSLGIDIGTASVKAVLLDENKKIESQKFLMHKNKIFESVQKILSEIISDKEEYFLGMCCENGFDEVRISIAEAIQKIKQNLYPDAKSVILMGAHDTFYFSSSGAVFRNSNCASGTGAFFEEQAGRLEVSLKEISALQKNAKSIPNIAGRCSVFSKTDTIHLMQEGVPVNDILLGLSYASVRNFRANVLKNKSPEKPVLLLGGVMKNSGVLKAIQDLLDLKDGDYILPTEPSTLCAFGAASLAKKKFTGKEIKEFFLQKQTNIEETTSSLKPLYLFEDKKDNQRFSPVEFSDSKKQDLYLGVDIGSASIDLVLLSVIDGEKKIVYASYVRNLGNPVKTVQEEIAKIKRLKSASKMPPLILTSVSCETDLLECPLTRTELQSSKVETFCGCNFKENFIPQNAKIKGIAVTGSGREYVAKKIGAGMAINEITAQTEGAVLFNSDVETIFEIGGQDSKFISVKNGQMHTFEMNKVCAAGTGMFLEEMVKKLGITMKEFISLSMKSENPVMLENRCTVFIESSVTKAVAEGRKIEDICAGLSYAIASNYIERVVGQHEISNRIFVQGGIAFNKAVVCAFRAILGEGKSISISPYFNVTGAIGAASLCVNKKYLSFNEDLNRKLNQSLIEKSEKSYLGNYTLPTGNKKGVVGIPRVVFLHKMFPLFREMLTRLGYEVLLSPLSNSETVSKSQEFATEETCFPIKLIYGHIAWLLEKNIDYILLPRLYTIKHEGSVAHHDYACMYMQSSPLLMENAFHFKERNVKLLMPEFSIEFGKKFMLKSLIKLGRTLGAPLPKIIPAAIAGFTELVKHTERLEKFGEEQISGDEPVFVLISRVYNIIDPMLNMQIENHLMKLGCRVIHLEHLHASVMNVDRPYANLYWPFGQHQLTGLKIIRDTKNLYPIYITNHGCGPDTVIQHFFQNEFGDKPYLQLEVDEHSSPVGVITRLEAFLYSLRSDNPHEETEEVIVLPDYGEYTKVIENRLPKENRILKVPPLQNHKNFTYAINKEYHTLLVMLEEILNAVEKDSAENQAKKIIYKLFCLSDEGSETFGQYGSLIEQELKRRGFDTVLEEFILEDLILRGDYEEIFKEIFDIDERQISLSSKKSIVIGEPLCVYKDYIFNRNLGRDKNRVLRMSLGEALLFHLIEIDRKNKWKNQISKIRKMHETLCKKYSASNFFTPMEKLFSASKGKVDFLIGNFARYRFSKILCLENDKIEKAIFLNSTEENSATVLKCLIDSYRDDIKVPVSFAYTDYTHTKEDTI